MIHFNIILTSFRHYYDLIFFFAQKWPPSRSSFGYRNCTNDNIARCNFYTCKRDDYITDSDYIFTYFLRCRSNFAMSPLLQQHLAVTVGEVKNGKAAWNAYREYRTI